MKGKITKSVLFILSAIVLVLTAVFFYINNDLSVSGLKKAITGAAPSQAVEEGRNNKEEADLDTILNEEDSEDNFDDVVM